LQTVELDLHHIAIQHRGLPIFRKDRQLLGLLLIVSQHCDAATPGGFLAVNDFTPIEHSSLNDAIAGHPAVFDNTPITVLFTVFDAFLARRNIRTVSVQMYLNSRGMGGMNRIPDRIAQQDGSEFLVALDVDGIFTLQFDVKPFLDRRRGQFRNPLNRHSMQVHPQSAVSQLVRFDACQCEQLIDDMSELTRTLVDLFYRLLSVCSGEFNAIWAWASGLR
jgi:hypothetical protein